MVRIMSNEGGAEEIGLSNEERGGEPGSNALIYKEDEEEDNLLEGVTRPKQEQEAEDIMVD